jgi:protein-S-isoprenylcysteine O-methyltransferase Ste14
MTFQFHSIFFLILIAVRAAGEYFFQPRGQNLRTDHRTGAISLTLMVAGYSLCQAITAINLLLSNDFNARLYAAGVVFFSAASIGRCITLRTLGRSYSTSVDPGDDSALVTSGAYSFIRHPLYLFYSIELSGFLMINFNFFSLACSALVIGAIISRIPAEERALAKRFGMSYIDYCKKTKMMIPFIV